MGNYGFVFLLLSLILILILLLHYYKPQTTRWFFGEECVALYETADYNVDYWTATGRSDRLSYSCRSYRDWKHHTSGAACNSKCTMRMFSGWEISIRPLHETYVIHTQPMHSMQGSSPGLWTIREIQSRVPVPQEFSANTIRSSSSFYLHTTQTTRDNHPYSKYSQCLNDRRYCASDLTISRVYRVENMFWNLLNI